MASTRKTYDDVEVTIEGISVIDDDEGQKRILCRVEEFFETTDKDQFWVKYTDISDSSEVRNVDDSGSLTLSLGAAIELGLF